MGEKIYTLRMDEDLFNKVKESAEKNRRSIAKEIENIVDLHFSEGPDIEQTYTSSELDRLFTRLVELMNEHGPVSGRLLPPDEK